MFAFNVLVISICLLLFRSESFYIPSNRLLTKHRSACSHLAVSEVVSVGGFEETLGKAGSSLVVIDYSTTWCGPCKMVLPRYVELSAKYENVVFLKCIGDSSPDASALMKREGVRSVPAFHFWKGGKRVDTVNGARIEDVEAAVISNM